MEMKGRIYCETCGADLYQLTFTGNVELHPDAKITVKHREDGMHSVEFDHMAALILSGLPQEVV